MDREALKQKIGTAAKRLGKEINEHMLDTIEDMETTARDSIIRVGVVCFIVGALLGWIAF